MNPSPGRLHDQHRRGPQLPQEPDEGGGQGGVLVQLDDLDRQGGTGTLNARFVLDLEGALISVTMAAKWSV